MKQEEIVNDSKPAASSTLSKEEGNAMSKLFEVMVSLRSIYDVNFRNLVEEYGHVVAKDLSEKEDLVLANPPFSERRDHNDEHVKYDVLCSGDIKDGASF